MVIKRIPIGEARELHLTDDEFAHLIRHIEHQAPTPEPTRQAQAQRCYCWRNKQGRVDCTTPQACGLPDRDEGDDGDDGDQHAYAAGVLLWPLAVAAVVLIIAISWMAW